MNRPRLEPSAMVLSFMALRRAIGILGTGLPVALALGKLLLQGPGLEPSISDYYYTVMGNVFVGTLCAIGVFMLSYHGYGRADDLAGDLACCCAVGVALFPTAPAQPTSAQTHIGMLHYAFAAGFFLTLAYFCLVQFRKTDAPHAMTRRKQHRNRVYSICGYGILVCLVLLALYALLPPLPRLDALEPVFMLETVAIELFGLSWLVKGEAILADGV